MCKDMADAERRELHVREDNPAERVHPPERGEARAKNYLYSSEFRRLIKCQAIRVDFRSLYAVAVYTYARGGELAALEWSDVHLEHGVIHITKSVDAETRKVKSTKTGTTRRIPWNRSYGRCSNDCTVSGRARAANASCGCPTMRTGLCSSAST